MVSRDHCERVTECKCVSLETKEKLRLVVVESVNVVVGVEDNMFESDIVAEGFNVTVGDVSAEAVGITDSDGEIALERLEEGLAEVVGVGDGLLRLEVAFSLADCDVLRVERSEGVGPVKSLAVEDSREEFVAVDELVSSKVNVLVGASDSTMDKVVVTERLAKDGREVLSENWKLSVRDGVASGVLDADIVLTSDKVSTREGVLLSV